MFQLYYDELFCLVIDNKWFFVNFAETKTYSFFFLRKQYMHPFIAYTFHVTHTH